MGERNVFARPVLQRLYRYAYSLCADSDDAYDLLQNALEKYLQNYDDKENTSELPYIRTIMRNQFIDQYRRKNKFPEEIYQDEKLLAIGTSSLEEVVIAELDLEALWEKLEPFEREILYYWAVEEMTAQEISVELNIPRGTILSRIFRLRKRLVLETQSGQVPGDELL